jgi:hypothetical protein
MTWMMMMRRTETINTTTARPPSILHAHQVSDVVRRAVELISELLRHLLRGFLQLLHF